MTPMTSEEADRLRVRAALWKAKAKQLHGLLSLVVLLLEKQGAKVEALTAEMEFQRQLVLLQKQGLLPHPFSVDE